MARRKSKPADESEQGPGADASASVSAPHGGTPSGDGLLDEVESVARIGSYALDIASGRWVSSRGLDAIFGIDVGFERSVQGWVSLVHPAEREAMVAYFTDEVLGRGRPFDRHYRIVRADTGEERWVHGRGKLDLDAAGRPRRMFGTIADVTELQRLQVQDRQLAQAVAQTGDAILITNPTGEIEYANPAFKRLNDLGADEPIDGNASVLGSLRSPAATEELRLALAAGAAWSGEAVIRRRDGTERVVEASISPVLDAAGTMTELVNILRDVTEERVLEAERARLVAAVEQTSDSVMTTDLAGTIEYVNPAFALASGYRRDEVIGKNPRILKSGRQSAAFYRALWRRLTRGQTWTGTLINRRKDGARYEEDATISPIRGQGGTITGYVAVKRDVTALRAAESSLSGEFRERAEVAAALSRLQPRASVDETAAEICDELFGLPGVDVAAIFNFLDPQRAVPLAVNGPAGLPMAPGQPLPVARARYLYERAAQGPWAEAWRPRPEDGQYGEAILELGIRAIAYAPIRNGEGLLGLVAAGTRDEAYANHLIDHLPVVGEFAATASALLSGPLELGHRDARVREHIQRLLADRDFSPVFQPIVALASGEAIGYEALTRFADGTPPDQVIADAHSVGLGPELEIACLAAALEAADALPPDAWLSLNISPDLIVYSRELAALLADHPRRIVLEITEHAEIDDYGVVRAALAGLGPTVSLAVDDAGAGFASLRHVVELAPRFLKLDVSLVRHVDRDLTRQAMVAGLSHFATRADCEVIAEGIEDPAELAMLRELGVSLGQGFLLGPPTPARAIQRPKHPRASRPRHSQPIPSPSRSRSNSSGPTTWKGPRISPR